MAENVSPSFSSVLRWLSLHAGFPRTRLPEKAELLILIQACAAAEEAAAAANAGVPRKDAALNAAMRAHQMRRSLVHYRCDNSAKV